MFKRFLLVFVVVFSSCNYNPAFAETSLLLGAWSHHFDAEAENESHNLVGITYNKCMLAYYKNSYENDTIAAAFNFESERSYNVSALAYLGLVRGYEECYGDNPRSDKKVFACPYVMVGVKYHTDLGINPQFMLSGTVAVLTFSIPIGDF